jgi:hypothetical protein
MATSAKCTYSAVPMGGVFNYEVQLHNTSPYPYDIYAFLFGWQFNVDITRTFPLQNIILISSPPGWTGGLLTEAILWGTNFQGSAIASGYILPGQTGKFVFQSSTAPPEELPFGCGFYNNANAWGFGFNGTAYLAGREPVPVPPAIYNPWWWIETRGGLVPPGPPPPWLQEFLGALALAGNAGVTPQQRAGLLERALEQIPIATAALKAEIKALQQK